MIAIIALQRGIDSEREPSARLDYVDPNDDDSIAMAQMALP